MTLEHDYGGEANLTGSLAATVNETQPDGWSAVANKSTTRSPAYGPHTMISADGNCTKTSWRVDTVRWYDVADWIEDPADRKECGGYVLGDFDRQPDGTVRRTKDAFRSAWAIKLDADGNIDADLPDRAAGLGFTMVGHTTASSTKDDEYWRFLFLADRDMTRDELHDVTRALEHELGAHNFDPTAWQGERFMYKPSRGKDGSYDKRKRWEDPLPVDKYVKIGRALRPVEPERKPVEPVQELPAGRVNDEVTEITAAMDALAAKPTGQTIRYRGVDLRWDHGFFRMACDLVRVANSSAGVLTLEQARAAFLSHAPQPEPGFNPERKWADAVERVGDDGVNAIKEVETGNDEGDRTEDEFDTTEYGLALTFAGRGLRERFRYANGLGWLEWDGKRWDTECDDRTVDAAIAEMVPDLAYEWFDARATDKDLIRLRSVRNLQKAHAVGGFLQEILRVHPDSLDQDPYLLNTQNYTVDLATGIPREHRRSDLITKITTVAYKPDAQHKDWDEALKAIEDDETLQWLQKKFGQAITGLPATDEALAILKGGGSNGKSAILDAIMGAIGDYGVALSPKVLTGNNSDHPTERMALRGARLAISEELPDGRHLNEVTVKQLIGTARITARKMRQDNVEFAATHTMFVTTNYDLQISGSDDGTWRRLQLVPFPLRFVKGEPQEKNERKGDPNLKRRLNNQGQQEAVLAWLIWGAKQLLKNCDGVTPEPSEYVVAATAEWRASADSVYAYVQDRIVFDPSSFVLTRDLYKDFSEWLKAKGGMGISEETFSGRFFGAETVRINGVYKDRKRLPGEGLSRPSIDWLDPTPSKGKKTMLGFGMAFAWKLEKPLTWAPLRSTRSRGWTGVGRGFWFPL